MFKKVKENKKGFTLAELLIVVAIIAVLVAISIPIFTSQLEKSREATDAANIRDYYAEIAVAVLDESLDGTAGHTSLKLSGGLTATRNNGTGSYTVDVTGFKVNQKTAEWQSGAQDIAGYTIAGDSDMVGATKITYTFTQPTNGNDYLSGISFSK